MAKKLFIMCTHGPNDPERATVAFVMANTAIASDVEVIIGLQVDGVLLAGKGCADTVQAPVFPPLKDLFAAYLEADGKILVCGPCAQARNMDLKDGLVSNATVVGAATFVEECASADNVLFY